MNRGTTLTARVIVAALFATPGLAEESPARLICERFEAASVADRVELVIQFSRSIDSTLWKIDPRHARCVQDRLEILEPERRAYCASRAQLGHDLALGSLDELGQKFFEIEHQCFEIRIEEEKALYERIVLETCDQLGSAYAASLDLEESNQSSQPERVRCARKAFPEHASDLSGTCRSGALSVRAAFVELGERVSKECPAPQQP